MRKKAVLLAAITMAVVFGNTGAAGEKTRKNDVPTEKIRAEVDGRRIFWDYGDEAIRLSTEGVAVFTIQL